MTAPHLLFFAIGFPPAAKSSTYRLRETANQFAALGWRVTVVNADEAMWRQDFGVDPSLLEGLHPGVRRVELPLRRPDLETDVRSFSEERALDPAKWLNAYRKRSMKPFPEPIYGRWKKALAAAADEIHAEDPVDLVLASCAPYVLLSAARHLYETHGVPYAIDFRDGWSIDVVEGEVAFDEDSRRGRIERETLGDALSVWVVNEPIAGHYRTRYPALADRIHVVRNGFDAQSRPVPSTEASTVPLTFGYLGTLNFGAAMLKTVLDAWREARASEPLLSGATFEVRGHVSSGARRETNAVAQVLSESAEDGVVFGGPVAKGDVASTYERWDALTLILIGGGYVTSGKVYEYAATGLPIVPAHDRDHDAAHVLRGYPLLAGTPSLDVEELAESFRQAARLAVGASERLRAQARAHAAPFERPHQMEPAVRALAALVQREEATA